MKKRTVPVYPWGMHMDVHPVTVAEMKALNPGYKSPWPDLPESIPATEVTWREANVLATLRGMRLPSTIEWFVAGSGQRQSLFPWGDEEDPSRCNCKELGIGHPTPVDQFDTVGASPFGVCDMMGNVWEMTSSEFPDLRKPYDDLRSPVVADFNLPISLPEKEQTGAGVSTPTIVGGHYGNELMGGGLTGEGMWKRDICLPESGAVRIGFRCVADFADGDFDEYAWQVHAACRSLFSELHVTTYPADGVFCSRCNTVIGPNEAKAIATTKWEPWICCRKCLPEMTYKLAMACAVERDGVLYYGRPLAVGVAFVRGVPFIKSPWAHRVPGRNAHSILDTWP